MTLHSLPVPILNPLKEKKKAFQNNNKLLVGQGSGEIVQMGKFLENRTVFNIGFPFWYRI